MFSSRFTIILILLFFTLSNLVLIAKPSYADIPSILFIGYAFSGLDPYYGVSVVGYCEGSYGSLIVTVRNDAGEDVLLNNLTLVFEWGDRFTETGLPVLIPKGVTRVFIIDFTVPYTTIVTNIRPYTYYVEANYTTLVTNVTRVWIFTPTNYFVVLSKEQKEYLDLKNEFSNYLGQYPTYWFTSIKAIELVRKALVERDYAEYYYRTGNFTYATIKYISAIQLYKNAISIEINYRSISEEIGINRSLIGLELDKMQVEYLRNMINTNKTKAEAELIRAQAEMKLAEAEMVRAEAELKRIDVELKRIEVEFKRIDAELEAAKNARYYAYALMVFGIGFIIISIGLVFKFMKK